MLKNRITKTWTMRANNITKSYGYVSNKPIRSESIDKPMNGDASTNEPIRSESIDEHMNTINSGRSGIADNYIPKKKGK